ncbi:hypothetical protein KZ126_005044 [Salmonella enterica]|uniref:Uncharacterized protein n=1 Tax=Salmonella enterica subsp. houtenae serovar 45:g,z51:- TaxID=1967611 RepID=A0A736RDE8_SALHO|nr:hypothetical protein [Salmonella enterica subsp. houtenae str. CFSAN000557]EHU5819376.1 hypothetical protein [Salmonella enterica]HAE7767815.1 hypothetical protein [Salmonella enterica subsp. houtenae serovar 45:g,z51:-]EHU5827554.1 hypothetical protein [Salmonella enterica]EHV2051963.1 hypothetical protein [Salmonella enterica]
MTKKTFDLNALGKSALLQEQRAPEDESNESKKNKLIRGIPANQLEAIANLRKQGVYRLSANDFFLDAVAEKLERMTK